jgi:hypothetical protein
MQQLNTSIRVDHFLDGRIKRRVTRCVRSFADQT